MSRFAVGKKSKFISDRSGFAFPYRERVMEWNGNLVHRSEYERKHPQLTPRRPPFEPQALHQPRPQETDDNNKFIVYTNTGLGLIGTELSSFSATSSLGTVTVSVS
tara:strand:+ start:886 stop:1203 length:318 start_codon:yes stop_codon:yes gene_type:complete